MGPLIPPGTLSSRFFVMNLAGGGVFVAGGFCDLLWGGDTALTGSGGFDGSGCSCLPTASLRTTRSDFQGFCMSGVRRRSSLITTFALLMSFL